MEIRLTEGLIRGGSLVIAVLLLIVAFALLAALSRRAMPTSVVTHKAFGWVWTTLFLAALYFWTKSLGVLIALLIAVGPVARIAFGTLAVIVAAWILVDYKKEDLRGYALIELAFGVLVAVHTMSGLNDVIAPADTLGIVAAVYLMVRGFDNLLKALSEKGAREKPAEASSGS
jgi:hypothetical protein